MTMTVGMIRKEARALAPLVACGLAAIVAAGSLQGTRAWSFLALASAFATLATGAQSIGHEFSERTLPVLLSQPVARWKLLSVKLAALAGALLLIAGAATFAGLSADRPMFVLLPLGLAFFAAPWLTMVSRSTLAGAVFAFAIPALLFLGTQYVASIAHGALTDEAARGARDAWLTIVALALVVTGIDTWRRFARLEALDGASEVPFQLPGWRWRSGGPSRPLLMLVRKEMRLHHISLLAATGYTALGLSATAGLLPGVADGDGALLSLTTIFITVIPLVIGATTSAEERQFGTREWQLTLPVAGWQQWLVKVGVSLGLAVALGFGLPMLLGAAALEGEPALGQGTIARFGLPTILPLVTVGIYVSSLSSSGVRAIAAAFPTGMAVVLVAGWMNVGYVLNPQLSGRAAIGFGTALGLWAYGLSGVALWLAYLNHRSAHLSAARVVAQIGGVFAVAAAGLFTLRWINVWLG